MAVLGLGLGLGLRRKWGGGFSPEAEALFARFTTPPTDERKVLINNLIVSLKANGTWAKRDVLYIMAGADAQAGQRNWIADAYNLSPTNAPTFTADRGYAGNGTTSYLDTGFNLQTNGVTYLQNSAHLGLWDLTSRAANTGAEMGNKNTAVSTNLLVRFSSNLAFARINDGSPSGGFAVADSAGFLVGNRSSSTARQIYKNGASIGAYGSIASGVPASANLRICMSPTADGFSTDQIAIASAGGSLSAAEVAADYTAFQTYLTAVGAA